MNILSKTKTYLVGGMQYEIDGRSWREDMTEFLRKMNVTVFNPYDKPFINAPEEDENTHQRMADLIDSGNFDEVAAHFKKVRASWSAGSSSAATRRAR